MDFLGAKLERGCFDNCNYFCFQRDCAEFKEQLGEKSSLIYFDEIYQKLIERQKTELDMIMKKTKLVFPDYTFNKYGQINIGYEKFEFDNFLKNALKDQKKEENKEEEIEEKKEEIEETKKEERKEVENNDEKKEEIDQVKEQEEEFVDDPEEMEIFNKLLKVHEENKEDEYKTLEEKYDPSTGVYNFYCEDNLTIFNDLMFSAQFSDEFIHKKEEKEKGYFRKLLILLAKTLTPIHLPFNQQGCHQEKLDIKIKDYTYIF